MTLLKKFAGAAMASTMTLALAAGPADAALIQDGLVNVRIGNITVQDINVAVAAEIVATACDVVDVTAVAGILAVITGVDAGDRSATFCKSEAGKVKVSQN